MTYDQLKLNNQLCFPAYATSRLITREYKPFLDELGITYPQYLVMLVLWEHKKMTVNEISKKLILNTNTTTPLLKRLEQLDLIKRDRSDTDERSIIVSLTQKGNAMKDVAAEIPLKLSKALFESSTFDLEELLQLKSMLDKLIGHLNKNSQ